MDLPPYPHYRRRTITIGYFIRFSYNYRPVLTLVKWPILSNQPLCFVLAFTLDIVHNLNIKGGTEEHKTMETPKPLPYG